MRADFYVYILFRPNGHPCYVGKGKGYRWRAHYRGKTRHNPHLRSIIINAGDEIPCVIIRSSLTEEEAFEIERAFIAAIGRREDGGPLVNLTDGGEGRSGSVATAEAREKMSAIWDDQRRAEKAAVVARLWSDPEYRDHMVMAHRGYVMPTEQRAKIGTGCKGKGRPFGIPHSEERKKHQSQKLLGVKKSDSHRKAISEGRKAMFAARRAAAKIAAE